uniref:Uncharacterized protein n=1 Tax=Geladintestivirus 3 TaxID=3233135 RepID=A0AAU8MKD1_9CAUD
MINGFDITYCLTVNILTYILVIVINNVARRNISRVTKRVILLVSIIVVTFAYVQLHAIDAKVLINSAILAPVSWSWIFKPIIKKLGYDYKDIDKTFNN